MSYNPFGARQAFGALTGLDFGLRVHVQVRPRQRAIFATVHNPSVQQLTTELVELVSSLRVHSFGLRGQLEQVTSAVQLNLECGSWRYARRAALDLAGLLAVQGESCALRIAQLCAREAC
jgi:hypothetical protein